MLPLYLLLYRLLSRMRLRAQFQSLWSLLVIILLVLTEFRHPRLPYWLTLFRSCQSPPCARMGNSAALCQDAHNGNSNDNHNGATHDFWAFLPRPLGLKMRPYTKRQQIVYYFMSTWGFAPKHWGLATPPHGSQVNTESIVIKRTEAPRGTPASL